MMNLKDLSVEQLVALKGELNAKADAARAEAKAVAAELQLRANVAEFERLPESKKAAYRHVIGAEGIPSGAKVGAIGAK